MRKIISFLALLVIAFALPHRAVAMTVYWDNSSKKWGSPRCHYWGGSSESSWPGDNMTNVNGSIWSCEIPDNSTGVVFNEGSDSGKTGDLTPVANHVYNSGGDVTTLYMYKTDMSKIGEATIDIPTFTYTYNNIPLTSGDLFVLSGSSDNSEWSKINSTQYGTGDNKDIPGTDISFSKTTNGAWKATQTGNYNVTVGLATMKSSAVLATAPWDFSSNTYPEKVICWFDSPYAADHALTFSGSVWSSEFVAVGTSMQFKLKAYEKSADTDYKAEYGEDYTATVDGDWVGTTTTSNDNWYKVTGLTDGNKYRLEVTENGAGAFKYRVVSTAPWDFSGNSRPSSVKATSVTGASSTSLNFTYNDALGTYKWVSQKFKATDTDIAFKLELSDGDETLILGKDTTGDNGGVVGGTTSDGDSGTYKYGKLTVGKYYQIEIAAVKDNMFKYKVVDVLPDNLYLYTSKSSWSTPVEPTSVSDGVYTFTYTFAQGEYFVLTTSTGSGYDALKENWYTHGTTNTTVQNGVASSFYNTKTSSWEAPIDGTYDITVNWTAQTLTATWTEAPLDLSTAQAVSLEFSNQAISLPLTKTGDVWSSNVSFTALNNNTYANFYLKVTKSDGTTAKYGLDAGTQTLDTWADVAFGYGNVYFQGGLATRKNYLVEVKPSTTSNQFQFRFTETAGPLYMYKSSGDNVEQLASATSDNGIYTFNFNFTADTWFVLSTTGSQTTWGGINSTRYSPTGSDVPLPVSGNLFGQTDGGDTSKTWSVTGDNLGNYTITVDWNAKTLTAVKKVAIPENVYLPLSSLDFEGGKKHYFLVGEREGEWRLQPEWEFKVVDGTNLVLENRFMYNGKFAIGVVDNYADYAMHKYKYYYQNYGFKTGYQSCTSGTDASFASNTFTVTKGVTMNNPSGVFNSLFDEGFTGDDTQEKNNYYQGAGTFMTQIKVGLTEAGLPKSIEFVIGSSKESAANRLFTLVGSDIYNKYYCNSSSDGATTHYNSMDGWQEGWIQYDPNTNKPYVDGLGEYLYHTSFTPDYLLTHPVQFNHGTPNGDFSYSSTELQFIKASELSNLATDPYKDFYKSISDNQIVKNGDPRSGNGYNYTIQTYRKQAEDANPTVTPNGTWDCYVVRDMWISGQLKFWSGWGGNDKSTGGGSTAGASGAAWHGPNGGPDAGSVNNHTDVEGFDINAGTEVKLYKNIKNLEANYQVSTDGTPKYFNRVVLWYDNVGGINNSFIQFVQETAGPAIFAQVTTNTDANPNKDNWIEYNWYLQNAGTTDTTVKVVGYEITRYRMDNGVEVFDGYPEGGYVSVADKNVKVSDLLQGSGTMPAWTTFTDKSADAELGFTPGLYRYKITITLDSEGGPTKTATSNQVAIYSDEAVTLQPMALQLVKLSKEGKTALGTTNEFLTYSPSDNATFYAMNLKEETVTVEGNSVKVAYPAPDVTIDEIPGAKALKFLNENPDKYWWTSDYYVRCLDYDVYKAQLQPQVDAGLINAISAPVVVIKETIGDKEVSRGVAKRLTHNGHNYYSLVMKRGGNVAQGTILTTLTYTTTNADGLTQGYESKATLTIDPVLPQPYGLTYGYDYSRATEAVTYEGKQWAKVNVPSGYWNESASKTPKPVYVKLDNNFRPDRLDLNVKFNRPNVVEEIYNKYDIVYGVSLGVKGASSSDLSFTAVDGQSSSENFAKPYTITVNGVNPENGNVHVFNFATTTYEPTATAKTANSELGRNNGTFGAAPSVDTKHEIRVNKYGGFDALYIGKIERTGSTWDWMYKGHKNFVDADDQLEGSNDNTLCFTVQEAIKPSYYLVELKDGSNSNNTTTYEYLVPHIADHYHGTDYKLDNSYKYLLDDDDPLIGTYVAKGFSEATPTVYATAMYLFEQKYEAVSEVAEGYNTVTIDSPAATLRRVKTAPGANPAAGNFGDLPDTGVAPTEAVEDKTAAYVAVAGATYFMTPGDKMVTGVEDVLADGEGAEAVYYNLQGVRVDNPASAGVYIRVQGKNVSKVVVK